jgi:D-amino peptidase
MKIYIMVDMEGISGIVLSAHVMENERLYFDHGRKYMTWDVNACVEGCIKGGATKVVVRDAHGTGYNLIWEELNPNAEYIQGTGTKTRMVEGFDGVILLGYHSMGGTINGVLEHTMSSKNWQNFWMNGVKCGEIAIDAAIAGDYGVPVIMVSGDDKACREAKRFLPWVITAQVKKGLGCQCAQLLPLEKAHDLIRTSAEKAVRNIRSMKLYRVKHPVTLRLELVSRGRVPASKKYVRVIDGRTYEVTGNTVEEALNLL